MTKIRSKIMDRYVLDNHPEIKGFREEKGLHEIHIFLLPLNPDKETVASYYDAVSTWNLKFKDEYSEKFGVFEMKACLLCLIFREKETFEEKPVFVMQSSIYIRSNDMSQIINECHNQASYFRDKGFVVLREKIEAMAYGNIGIPINSEELINYENNEFAKSPYFEFHIKCKFLHETDNEPITIENIELLKQCSNNITLKYNAPCPLSYNINRNQYGNDCAGNQRFLNIRFRNCGLKDIEPSLQQINNLLKSENIGIIKRISEYVWYDTNPDVDKGWIDFEDNEEKLLLSHLRNLSGQTD